MKKKIIIILICILILPNKIYAKTLNDYYNELANLQAQYNENKNNRDLTQAEINKIANEISNINDNITNIRKEISVAEEDISNSKKEIDNKRVETDGLLQFLQVTNGGNIFLEYLFDAENYTDFIYRYELVKQLTNYNSNLIDDLENLIITLQEKEKELENKQTKLEEQRKELTTRSNKLTISLSSYQSEGSTIESDINDLKKQIEAYEKLGCSRDQDVTTCTASITASGWKFPLAKGCVTSEYTGWGIRTDWSGGGSHHGIDLDCVGEGTKVYAAADGVVKRIYYANTNSKIECGGNMIYILHNINGKYYTTVYMHLLSFASGMYVGKVVTDDMVIGYMGGYSTATQHGGYDRCTTGAHLHFGIAEGDSAFNFNSHSINPREIYSFPKLVYSGGGYFYR